MTAADLRALRRALLAWYRRSARDLPWRRTRDPYRVWLSEVLLQQTRVEAARPYYESLVAAFPTVARLAQATLPQVLGLWQGLGYYRRAVNLHRAAQIIVTQRAGKLPRTAAEWQELPGVGRYTSSAIASIAFGEPVPVVDGNVRRVLARVFVVRAPLAQTRWWALAEKLLARRSPGAFNQALMELGARICTSRRPACTDCPVRQWCAAQRTSGQHALPIRPRKRALPQVEVAVALLRRNGRLLLVRRPATGLLANLWTLPGGERDPQHPREAQLRTCVKDMTGMEVHVGTKLATVEHAFSHRRWRVCVYAARLTRATALSKRRPGVRWVAPGQLADYPLATLDRKLLRAACRDELGHVRI